MNVFTEALRNLDCLRDLATQFVGDPNAQVDASTKEQALDNVVHLRRTVIEATRQTETDRTALDAAARKEGTSAVALSSLESRIHSIEERIKSFEKEAEARTRRALLEEANEQLAAAKDRLKAKRDLYEEREKKLKEFQKELGPALKLGTASYVSEFDDEHRVAGAFAALPRALQFLYGQLLNAKKAFGLPIEIGIVPVPRIAQVREAWSGEMDVHRTETMTSPMKKQRLTDRKMKHTSEEKRKKRWYDGIVGKEAGAYEDWINPQRTFTALGIQPKSREVPQKDDKANAVEKVSQKDDKANTVEKYETLMKLSEGLKKRMTSTKQSKRRKHRHPTRSAAEECTHFPLPIPKGDLCVEVKFLDGEKEVVVLTFTWHGQEAFVSSAPDRSLVRTIKQDDDAIQWEHEMKKVYPKQHKALIATFGYPFGWAQELCGAKILKDHDQKLSAEDLRQMNVNMMQQQEFIADFVMRTRTQAMELKAFKSSVSSMEEEAQQTGKKEKGIELIQFRQIVSEKLHVAEQAERENSSSSGLASGTWAAVMRKIPGNGKAADSSEVDDQEAETEQSADGKGRIKIKFYPHSSKELAKTLEISREEAYYEAFAGQSGPQFKMFPSSKLKEAAKKKSMVLESLEGPLSSADIGSGEGLAFGQFVVRKAAKVPKKFSSTLPVDYKARFFPFTLRSKRRRASVGMNKPEKDKQIHKAYRTVMQLGHIRLYALIRVNLLKPLLPTVILERVTAASSFKKKEVTPTAKDSKAKTTVDPKNKTEHIRTERERIMRRETEILKQRDTLEAAANGLQNLKREQSRKRKPKKTPSFHCEDARLWISRRVPLRGSMSAEDVVRKLEGLLQEWCTSNAKGVTSLNTYLGSGSRSKTQGRQNSSKRPRSSRVAKEPSKEKPVSAQAGTKHGSALEEELEQGEIPAIPKPKHTARHRSPNRRAQSRDVSYKSRQRSRSPGRLRVPPNRMQQRDAPRNVRYPPRTAMRTGAMRMDDEGPRERGKGSNFPSRVTRM